MSDGAIQAAWRNVIGSVVKACWPADNRAWAEAAASWDPRTIDSNWWLQMTIVCGKAHPDVVRQLLADMATLAKLINAPEREPCAVVTPPMPKVKLAETSPRKSLEAAFDNWSAPEPKKTDFADGFGSLLSGLPRA